jgi:S1-C subfamily serine protease
MKLSVFKPILFLGVLIVLVGLACSSSSGTPQATQAPAQPQATQAPVQVQTEAPQVTEAPQAESGAVADLQDVKNAVVQIESQGTFVDPQVGVVANAAGRGSGFIIDPSGIAVTNNHVVTGGALYKVWVAGETEPRNARVLGVSECSDLAVIDIDGDGFPYLKWFQGPIDVGEDIYIAGFPLGDPEYTLTKGIISKAKTSGETSWASVESVLEYDAQSNPGNSGGPVVTPDGEVVAVHYAGNSSTRQAFGISRDAAMKVVDQLRSGENVDSIGVNGQAVSNEDGSLTGVWVSSVQSGSQADKAGLKPGDIITSMENLVLAQDGSMSQYCDILRSHKPGDTLSLEVLRWADNQVLDGQLNGRELAVTAQGGDTSGGDTSGGDTSGSTGTDIVNPNASASGDYYYFTDFDTNMDSWSYFLMSGTDDGFSSELANSKLHVDIQKQDTWVYFTYDDYTYTDVRVDTVAENLGRNTNNVSLICRYSDNGWYEFNVYNSGKYNILYYDAVVAKGYNTLYSGASTAINMGKATNEYTAVCVGNTLTLGINGVEVRTVTSNDLKEGQVGFGLSSFNVLPIIAEFDGFAASVP